MRPCAIAAANWKKSGTTVTPWQLQWCHLRYGYDKKGPLAETLNAYGLDYLHHGRDAAAVTAVDALDSDHDGFRNGVEMEADRFSRKPNDDPKKTAAPMRVYSRAQLEAFPQHKEFLLMNASKSGDEYAEYSGVSMEMPPARRRHPRLGQGHHGVRRRRLVAISPAAPARRPGHVSCFRHLSRGHIISPRPCHGVITALLLRRP